jgi:hypothetical protein
MRSLVALLVLSACGGGSGTDLTGIYRVDLAVGSMPCGADEPLPTIPPFLKFAKDEFLGQSYFKYDGCQDEAGTDCGTAGGLFSGFFEPISDGWRGVVTSSSGSGGQCALSYFEQTAILKKGALVIDGSSFRDQVELPEDKCEPDEAERRGDSMPCAEHEHIEATFLTK